MRRPKKKVYDYKKALRDNEKKKSPAKHRKIDLAPKDEVKEMFMGWFKKNRNVGQVMSKQNVINHILKNLDKKQDKVLESAMNDLKKSGFIEIQEDGVTLVLTQKGFDSLH
jgi:hypothetical protein